MSVDSRLNANVPVAPSTSSATTVTASNLGRKGFVIQNQGTNPLFVCFGTPVGANNVYHLIIQAGPTVAGGSGAIFSMVGGSCFGGAIYASGTGASYTFLEY